MFGDVCLRPRGIVALAACRTADEWMLSLSRWNVHSAASCCRCSRTAESVMQPRVCKQMSPRTACGACAVDSHGVAAPAALQLSPPSNASRSTPRKLFCGPLHVPRHGHRSSAKGSDHTANIPNPMAWTMSLAKVQQRYGCIVRDCAIHHMARPVALAVVTWRC